jgi:hypothetical protein
VISLIKRGDRIVPDERAAVVSDIDKDVFMLRLGVDAVDGGWQYRARTSSRGRTSPLTTTEYVLKEFVLRYRWETSRDGTRSPVR